MAKILLVEDDNNLREIFEMRLKAEGYTIVTAHDGEQALVVAMQEKPDLVISDVMMPKLSGFEMVETLKAASDMKNIKVIMMTALGQAEDRSQGDRLGVDRYLVKSQVTLEDFVRVTKEVLEGKPDSQSNAAATAPVSDAPPPAVDDQTTSDDHTSPPAEPVDDQTTTADDDTTDATKSTDDNAPAAEEEDAKPSTDKPTPEPTTEPKAPEKIEVSKDDKETVSPIADAGSTSTSTTNTEVPSPTLANLESPPVLEVASSEQPTKADELANIEERIQNFVDANQSANDTAPPPVNPIATPPPDKPAAETPESTSSSVPPVTASSLVGNEVASKVDDSTPENTGRGRVITPLHDPTEKPDLDKLLAEEEAKSGKTAKSDKDVLKDSTGAVIPVAEAPADKSDKPPSSPPKSDIDPNSVAL